MRILFVSEYFPPKIMGGGEINLSLLAKALVKEGLDISVITSYHPGLKLFEVVDGVKVYRRLKTGETASGISHNFKRSFLFPKSVEKEVEKLHWKKNFTLIHFIGTSIITAKKLKRLKVPLMATIESYPTLCPKGDRIYQSKQECKTVCSLSKFSKCQIKSNEIGKTKNKWFLKYNPIFTWYVYNYYKKLNKSLRYCNLISISEYIQKVLQQYGKKSVVIPNAINTKQFQHQKINNSKPKLLYLGSLTRFKGPQVLLKALSGLNCHLDLYGDGPTKNYLQKLINKNNLDAQIHSPVPYEKVPSLYANTDIIIFPSIWPEPFGRIAIEAMAAGKPVIGSKIGGISETIKKERGLLVQPNNIIELREKIKELLENKELYQNLSKKGLIEAKNYEEKVIIKKLIQVYQNLTN